MSTVHIPVIDLRLGQHVTILAREGERPGLSGTVERLGLDYPGDGGHEVPMVTVLLDKYIVLPAMTLSDGTVIHETTICRQTVPVHQVEPYDPRDDAIASLRDCVELLLNLGEEATWQVKAASALLEKLGNMEPPPKVEVLPAGEKAFTLKWGASSIVSRPIALTELLERYAEDKILCDFLPTLEIGQWTYMMGGLRGADGERSRCEVKRVV